MNKCWIFFTTLFSLGCQSLQTPNNFAYKEIKTSTFTLASWQKISSPQDVVKIYIEGDGYAFTPKGTPSQDPTPRQHTIREIAFKDPSPNVVYLARPCQFVTSKICSKRHWTSARFAPEVINSTQQAISKIAPNRELIIIGYSGGAQVAGLVAASKPQLHIKKLITIAGNLDHSAWTTHHNLPALNESMNLNDYRAQYLNIPQTHYIGENDDVIPPFLLQDFANNKTSIIIVPKANHNKGFEKIMPKIWQEN